MDQFFTLLKRAQEPNVKLKVQRNYLNSLQSRQMWIGTYVLFILWILILLASPILMKVIYNRYEKKKSETTADTEETGQTQPRQGEHGLSEQGTSTSSPEQGQQAEQGQSSSEQPPPVSSTLPLTATTEGREEQEEIEQQGQASRASQEQVRPSSDQPCPSCGNPLCTCKECKCGPTCTCGKRVKQLKSEKDMQIGKLNKLYDVTRDIFFIFFILNVTIIATGVVSSAGFILYWISWAIAWILIGLTYADIPLGQAGTVVPFAIVVIISFAIGFTV